MANNDRRLLEVLNILKTKTDRNTPIKESEIRELLNREGISVSNRKTLYKDIQTLIDYDYEIYYDTYSKAYYLEDAPFSFAEVKIILDSINSIDLDDKSRNKLTNKVLSFVSFNQAKILKDSIVSLKKQDTISKPSYINNLDTILNSIINTNIIDIEYNNKTYTVLPHFIYFSNNRYYLFVTFKDSDSIYSYRLDRIKKINVLDEKYEYSHSIIEKIKKRIKTSYGNLDKNKPELIQLQCVNYESFSNRLDDDFPNHYLDSFGNIVIEYRPNEQLFSKLVSYKDALKIKAPLDVKEAFVKYLKDIINNY